MNTYMEAKAASYEVLKARMPQIIASISELDGYTLGERYSGGEGFARVAFANGDVNITLTEEESGRITVRWMFGPALDKHRPSKGRPTSINISLSKTDAQIAGDIRRRFLPEFLPYVQSALDAKADSENDTRKAQTEARHLVNLGKKTLNFNTYQPEADSTYPRYRLEFSTPYNKDKNTESVKMVVSANSVTVEMAGISHELAEKVAALLAQEFGK